ncbi:MAG TPA: hypothetical protein VLE99_00055 [Candidatus Saccharimonadales bacterium]|nr:hypothetical protein [Candidatus Saccharimonadales bacterium]
MLHNTDPAKRPRRNRIMTATGLATAAILGLGGSAPAAHPASANRQPIAYDTNNPNVINNAADTIAFRYQGSVRAAADTGVRHGPLFGVHNPGQNDYTTVDVAVDIVDTPEARAALEAYQHDARVQWDGSPQFGADLEVDGKSQGIMVGSRVVGVTRNPHTGHQIVDIQLSLGTSYTSQQRADVYVAQGVSAYPNGLNQPGVDRTGVTTFGVLQFDPASGAWGFDPNLTPAIPSHLHVAGE